MKRFSEQLKKKSDGIRMRASERADLRERLVSYMEYHPLPADMKQQKAVTKKKTTVQGIPSEMFKTISINMTYVRSFAGVFAVFLVVGVPFIAERSVPGDVLYPVKTHLTEEVRASLTLSPYAKVEWETQRLERRVAEARLLASAGKLTPETEAEVAQAVKDHTNAANKEIAAIRENDADEAAIAEIAFASALEVQSEVLEGHVENEPQSTDGSPEGHSIASLADVVKEVRDVAEVAQTGNTPSYEKLLGRVESETTHAYELFASVQDYASTESVADIERRLADIERKVADAIAIHEVLTQEVSDQESEAEAVTPEDVDTAAEETEVVAETTEEESAQEEELIEAVDASASTAETEEASDIVAVAEEVVTTEPEIVVETALEEEITEEAVIAILRGAMTDLRKLISFMTDIDVRENVTIEELVPVTLTDEERIEQVTADTTLTENILQEIAVRNFDTEAGEKITFGITSLRTLLTQVETALETSAIESAETASQKARAFALDLQKMAAHIPVVEEVVPEPTEAEFATTTEETDEVTSEEVVESEAVEKDVE